MTSVFRQRAFLAFLTSTLVVGFVSSRTGAQQGPTQKPGENRVTEGQLDKWMQEMSSWGNDDLLGAANTITPEKRRQAAALVRTGESVSLSHDLVTGGVATNCCRFQATNGAAFAAILMRIGKSSCRSLPTIWDARFAR